MSNFASNDRACQAEWARLKALYPDQTRGWRFVYSNRSSRRYGCCKYMQRTIEVSKWHAVQNDEWAVLDTLKHEVAHILAGPLAGHGPKWKEACLLTGARPLRCGKGAEYSNKREDHHWAINCPSHGVLSKHKHRPTDRKMALWGCKKCRNYGKLTLTYKGTPVAKPDFTPVQTKPEPIGAFDFANGFTFFPAAAQMPARKVPAFKRATTRRSTVSGSAKLYAYGTIAPDGVRCTNQLGAREKRMGLTFTKLPRLMTKDEAGRWLRTL